MTTSAHRAPVRLTDLAGRPEGAPAPDAVWLLTAYLVLLLAVPSGLTITPLGALGRPATLWGILLLLIWSAFKIQQASPTIDERQPVKLVFTLFACSVLLSYAAAMFRGLPFEESSTADTALLRLASWGGVLLVANDGIADRESFLVLLRRLALAGGLMAALGLIQFVTDDPWIDRIDIPGMTADASFGGLQDRGGFTRSSGTAVHVLEYATVLAMSLPIALTLALDDKGRRPLARWFPVGTMVIASTLSVSRSGPLGVVAGVGILIPSWPRRIRRAAFLTLPVLAVAVYFLVPGMVGTIRGMFSGVGEDASVQSRTSSYALVGEFVARQPVFGRGLGTFLPQYRILDNQLLSLTIEVGLLGIGLFLGIAATAVWMAARARRRSRITLDRQLALSLAASVAAGTLLLAFFDGLAFTMSAGTFFLVLGLCGAAPRVLGIAGPRTVASERRTS